MYDPTPQELWEEIQVALEETAQHTDPVRDVVRRVVGRYYRKDAATLEADPENFAYSYLANVMPLLAPRNPRVECKSNRVIGHQVVTEAMNDGINTWIRDVGYKNRIERAILDFCFTRGVLLHYLDRESRHSRGTVTPAVVRISPACFFMDSLASTPDEAAYMGHWYYQDNDRLLDDPNVLPIVKQRLSGRRDGDGTDDVEQESLSPFEAPKDKTPARPRTRIYMVWMRETGMLRFLADVLGPVDVRPPVRYYGHRKGPYVLIDAYPVADEPWPLAPLVAVEDQSQDLNIHARAMGRAAARRKKIALVETSNADMGDQVIEAEDGEVRLVENLTGTFIELEVGGATPAQYQHTEYLRNRLDRVSGLTATVQGNVGAAETATEAQIASAGLDNRMSFLQDKVNDAIVESLERVGWYLFHTEGIVIPVDRRDRYSGEEREGVFLGGPSPLDNGATWDDFAIEIVPYTMVPKTPTQKKMDMLDFLPIFDQIINTAPMRPWVNSAAILADVARVFGLDDVGDKWVVWPVLAANQMPPQTPPSMLLGAPDPGRPGGVDPPRAFLPSQKPMQQAGGMGVPPQSAGGTGPAGMSQGTPRRDGNTTGPRPATAGGRR